MNKKIIGLLIFLMLFFQIQPALGFRNNTMMMNNKSIETENINDDIVNILNQVNESLVSYYLEELVKFGPRYTGSESCSEAAEYLFDEFEKLDLDVYYDYYEFIMKKITQDIILEKKQHLHILNTLVQHSFGLTLHELTYLLTKKNNMYKMSSLQERFGVSRINVFKTRQRINDCLTDLKRLNLIHKKGVKYQLNLLELHLLLKREKLHDELKKIELEIRTEYEEIENNIRSLSDNEQELYEAEFWDVYGKDFLKQYLTKK